MTVPSEVNCPICNNKMINLNKEKSKSYQKNIYNVGRFYACEKCGEVFERRKKSEHKCRVNPSN